MPINFGGACTVVPLSYRGNSVVAATHFPALASLKDLERENGVQIIALRADGQDLANALLNVIPDRN